MRWESAANLFSNLGTWMQLTVQNLLVLQLTGSAATTGPSLSAQAAPGLLLGLAGGTAVDAWQRKLTAAVCQAVLGLVAFVTAGLVAFHLLSVPVLLGLAALTGLIATVEGPATSLLGNDLVAEEDVPSAIALGSVVHDVGRSPGPRWPGWRSRRSAPRPPTPSTGCPSCASPRSSRSFAWCGTPNGRRPAPRPRRATRRDPGPGARAGLAFFLGRRTLVAPAVITAVSAVLGRNYALTPATLVTGPPHGGPAAYGAVSTVLAIGGTLGAVLAGRLRRPTVRLVGAPAAIGALLQVPAGLAPAMLMLLVLVVPMAIVESISDTAATTVLQTDPPAHLRGRVLGGWRSAGTAWGLVGPPLLGLLVQAAGARGALIAGGPAIVGVIGGGAVLLDRRDRRRAPVPAVVRAAPEPVTAVSPAAWAAGAIAPPARWPVRAVSGRRRWSG